MMSAKPYPTHPKMVDLAFHTEAMDHHLPGFVMSKVPTLKEQVHHYRSHICPHNIPFDPTGTSQAETKEGINTMDLAALRTYVSQVHAIFEQLSLINDAPNQSPSYGSSTTPHSGSDRSMQLIVPMKHNTVDGSAADIIMKDMTERTASCPILPSSANGVPGQVTLLRVQPDAGETIHVSVHEDHLTPRTITPYSGSLLGMGTKKASTTSLMSLVVREPVKLTGTLSKGVDDEGFKMINDYIILEELGKGNFGKVKLGFSGDRGNVAIKIIKRNPRASTQALAQGSPLVRARAKHFEREINIMKKTRHKNIVRLHEVIDDPEAHKLYLVMQYVDQGSLSKIRPDGTCLPVPPDTLASYAKQIAAGLAYLHRNGIYHRDIKPENILKNSDGEVFLSDFGISEVFEPDNDVDDEDQDDLESLTSNAMGGSIHSTATSGTTPTPTTPGMPPNTAAQLAPSLSTNSSNVIATHSSSSTLLQRAASSALPTPNKKPTGAHVQFAPVDAFGSAATGDLTPKCGSPPPAMVLPTRRERQKSVVENVAEQEWRARRPGTLAFMSPELLADESGDFDISDDGDKTPQQRERTASVLGDDMMLPSRQAPPTSPHKKKKRDAPTQEADADIWAFGVTLYALLTGRLPFPDVADIHRCNMYFASNVDCSDSQKTSSHNVSPEDASTLRSISPECSDSSSDDRFTPKCMGLTVDTTDDSELPIGLRGVHPDWHILFQTIFQKNAEKRPTSEEVRTMIKEIARKSATKQKRTTIMAEILAEDASPFTPIVSSTKRVRLARASQHSSFYSQVGGLSQVGTGTTVVHHPTSGSYLTSPTAAGPAVRIPSHHVIAGQGPPADGTFPVPPKNTKGSNSEFSITSSCGPRDPREATRALPMPSETLLPTNDGSFSASSSPRHMSSSQQEAKRETSRDTHSLLSSATGESSRASVK